MGLEDYFEELRARGFTEADGQTVCLECILDEGLREQVARHLTSHTCTFCGRKAQDGEPIAADFNVLMELVMGGIRFLYQHSIEVLYADDDFTPRLTSEEVAEDVCSGRMTDEVFQLVVQLINEDEWSADPSGSTPDEDLRYSWSKFCDKVKHESRFVFLKISEQRRTLNPWDLTAGEMLQELARVIESNDVIVDVEENQVYYRGRMVDAPKPLNYNASTLGSPPLDVASANRMSPAGVSMFYGCGDVPTVVAEIGAHTAKRFAVVGQFEAARSLRMIDLVNLPPIPSIFDPDKRGSYYDILFLYGFARDLSEPVVLDGREHIDYVPTQVVTEYFRWMLDASVDGILYTSSQNGGTCCVIFCGPESCSDVGKETDKTILRLKADSLKPVRVVPGPVEP